MSIIFLIIFLYYAPTFWNFDNQSKDNVWKNHSNSLNRKKTVDHASQLAGKRRKGLCCNFFETSCGHVATSKKVFPEKIRHCILLERKVTIQSQSTAAMKYTQT